MQSRRIVFLTTATIVLSLFNTVAQQYQGFTMPTNRSRVLKSDTIVIKTGVYAEGYSKNGKDTGKIVEPLVLKQKIRTVPLAGEKLYFGSMNDYVIAYTRKYMASHNRTLHSVRGRGNQRFSLMENVFKKHNIPKELKYLAVIESALNNNAVSPVGAVGPWQFMESTARLMGLTMNANTCP